MTPLGLRRRTSSVAYAAASKRVRTLRLPRRLSMDELVRHAERVLGKRIDFEVVDLNRGLSAQLIQRRDVATIQTHTDLSEPSRMACILHELAHVLMRDPECDHMPYLDMLSGRVAYQRADLDDPHERVVELIADDLALRTGVIGSGAVGTGIFK
jgi:hypothetical protein